MIFWIFCKTARSGRPHGSGRPNLGVLNTLDRFTHKRSYLYFTHFLLRFLCHFDLSHASSPISIHSFPPSPQTVPIFLKPPQPPPSTPFSIQSFFFFLLPSSLSPTFIPTSSPSSSIRPSLLSPQLTFHPSPTLKPSLPLFHNS